MNESHVRLAVGDEAKLFHQRKETITARMTQSSIVPIFFKWSEITSYLIVERELPFVCLFVFVFLYAHITVHEHILTPMNYFARVTILFVWAFLFHQAIPLKSILEKVQ